MRAWHARAVASARAAETWDEACDDESRTMKRIAWLFTGVCLGFWLSIRMARSIRRAPRTAADRMALTVRDVWGLLREAALDGREAMLKREAELRAELDARAARRLDGDADVGPPIRPRA